MSVGNVIRCRGSKICSPFVSSMAPESIFYVASGTGEVYEYIASTNEHHVLSFTGGEPFGALVDASSGKLLIADCAHSALLRVEEISSGTCSPAIMVKTYEEKPLRGPNGVAIAPPDLGGAIYFTDSGPFGETTLEKPKGSVYMIGSNPSGGQTLRPIVYESLAHPSGLAVSPQNPKVIYVAELFANRVLRLVQRPANVHHTSVFYQFAGGMGPSCVTCGDNGVVYVGLYDFAGHSDTGRIVALTSSGQLIQTYEIPCCEITGICLSLDSTSLLVTEASTSSLYQISL